MNEMEIYEYLECMLKIIKNNKMHKKIPVLCFIGCGRSTVQQRFDLIIRGQEKKYKHRGYILYIMVFLFQLYFKFCFLHSSQIIIIQIICQMKLYTI